MMINQSTNQERGNSFQSADLSNFFFLLVNLSKEERD